MSELRVKCIRCQKEWSKPSPITQSEHNITSSLCTACFREVAAQTIHRKQLREGNFDCFAKADAYCDQNACKYRLWCLRHDQPAEAPMMTACC